MRPGFLLTKADGSTVLLFNRDRAHGLAAHFGWSVKELSPAEAAAHNRKAIASAFKCTPDQVAKQFARNSASLSGMAAKAEQSGCKVNGYEAHELRAMAGQALKRSL